MKKKTIKKLAKMIHLEFNSIQKKNVSTEEAKYYEEWCDFNIEVSNKLKKLVFDIIKYQDNINLSCSINSINIDVSDIQSIKKDLTTSKFKSKISEENSLRISIEKDRGFIITIGYRKSSRYKDENLYNEMIDIVKNRISEINASNFDSIWEIILKDSGILRDNNIDMLDNLLNDEPSN